MAKKIIIGIFAAASIFASSLPASAQTAQDYQLRGAQMMSGMMGSQFNNYQAAWQQEYGDDFVNNMYKAMGQYAWNNPDTAYRLTNMMGSRYGMMGIWNANNMNFGLIRMACGIIGLIWIVNSVLIGYLLVVLIQKFSRKK